MQAGHCCCCCCCFSCSCSGFGHRRVPAAPSPCGHHQGPRACGGHGATSPRAAVAAPCSPGGPRIAAGGFCRAASGQAVPLNPARSPAGLLFALEIRARRRPSSRKMQPTAARGRACWWHRMQPAERRKEKEGRKKNNNNNNAELLNGFLMNKTNPIDAACVFKPIQLSADAIKIIRCLT